MISSVSIFLSFLLLLFSPSSLTVISIAVDSHGRHLISDVFSPLKDFDGLSRTSHWIDKDGFDCYSTSTSFGDGIDHEKVLKDGFNDGGDGNKDDGLFKIQKRKKRGLAGKGEGEIDFVVDDGFLDEDNEDPFDL